MARMARVVVPQYPHHVTQRGNRRQLVFFGEEDCQSYIALLQEACDRSATGILAYCLMPNHVHLIMVPRHEDGLRAAIAEAHRRYTRRVNFREGWRGHLWQERFHSVVMDEMHLAAAIPYVEENPVRAGLCDRAEQWPWSSARARLLGDADPLLAPELLESMLPACDTSECRIGEETHETLRLHTRTGRPLGSDGFVDRIESMTGRALRPGRPGPARRER